MVLLTREGVGGSGPVVLYADFGSFVCLHEHREPFGAQQVWVDAKPLNSGMADEHADGFRAWVRNKVRWALANALTRLTTLRRIPGPRGPR